MPTGLLALPSVPPIHSPEGALRAVKSNSQVHRSESPFKNALSEARRRPPRDERLERRENSESILTVDRDHSPRTTEPDAQQPDYAAQDREDALKSEATDAVSNQSGGPESKETANANDSAIGPRQPAAATTVSAPADAATASRDDAAIQPAQSRTGAPAAVSLHDAGQATTTAANTQHDGDSGAAARSSNAPIDRVANQPDGLAPLELVRETETGAPAPIRNEQLFEAAQPRAAVGPHSNAEQVLPETSHGDKQPEKSGRSDNNSADAPTKNEHRPPPASETNNVAVDQLLEAVRRSRVVTEPVNSGAVSASQVEIQDKRASSSTFAQAPDASTEPNQSDAKPVDQKAPRHIQSRVNLPIENPDRFAPAVSRAAAVDLAVQLENATGQSMPGDAATKVQAHPAAPQIPMMGGPTAAAADVLNPALTLPTSQSDEAPFANRVVRGLTAMVNQRGGVMNMRLTPPELGDLRVQMTLARGVVSAEFQANSPQAQVMLEKNLAVLRHALENQGLTVERLVVHAPSVSGQQLARDDGNNNQNSASFQRHQHDAGGGESRGRQDHPSGDSPRHHRRAEFSSLFAQSESSDWQTALASGT